jgi:integrase
MRYLTKTELKALLVAIPTVSSEGNEERHQLMALMQFSHSLRVSEVINMLGRQIRNGFLTVQRLKGSEKTVHPLFEDADALFNEAKLIPEFMEKYKIGPKDRLFPMTRSGVLKLYQRAGKKAGIPEHKLTTHALKHTRNQLLSRSGVSLDYLQKFNGHRSMNSTAQYTKKTDEEACAAVIAATR